MRHDTTHHDAPANDGGKAILATLAGANGIALASCGAGILGLIAGFFMDRPSFWASYTFAFAFWMSLSIGFATLTFLHHAIRPSWSLAMLKILEAGNKTLLIMTLVWVPLALGVGFHQVYQWSNPDLVAHSAVLMHKRIYLNPTAWIIRGVIYFAFWAYALGELNKSSLKQEDTKDEILALQRQSFGAAFGVVHVLLVTAAAVDWFMSLDPIYYSSIYAVIYMMAGVLAATSVGGLFLTGFSRKYPFNLIVTPVLTKNVGNMMLGFTMFWAYTSLAQFLIQWCANLPEEISFYAVRFEGPLVFIGAAILIGQFIVPFLTLLSGRTKRTYDVLRNVAVIIIVMRIIDAWWQITPFFRRSFNFADLALDLGAWAAIGGLWVAFFLYNLKKYPLIATHDQRLIEAKAAHAHA